MPKFRVLVVDDAVIFRRLVSEELSKDPELEVVGTAANGRIALAKLSQTNPDAVILDVEMPEMDGLATLKELRKTYPRLPVIMFSALTERGASATLDALSLGASDYFTKPTGDNLESSLAVIREQLIPEVKTLCAAARARIASQELKGVAGAPLGLASTNRPSQSVQRPASKPRPIEILAIGTSTGGPNALAEVFSQLPVDLPVPVVIVQHMPPMFTRLLAERLTAQFHIPTQEAVSGSALRPGAAWIAPGDHHMIVVRQGTEVRTFLNQDPPENSCRPAVDVLLRSVAKTYGANSLTVILTGMGQDGLRGCEVIRETGGQILAQDETSSVVWGMPGAVARAGLANRVMPLSLIADEILHRIRQDRTSS